MNQSDELHWSGPLGTIVLAAAGMLLLFVVALPELARFRQGMIYAAAGFAVIGAAFLVMHWQKSKPAS